MSWATIARKDFRDARRSLTLWLTIGVFTALLALLTAFASDAVDEPAQMALYSAFNISAFVLPIVMLVMGYLAVVGEYESGTIRYLLGMPVSRRDVLFGKLVGRSAIAVLAILVAVLVAVGITLFRFGSVPGDLLVVGLPITILYGLTFTSVAVSISAMTSTRARAMGGAIAVYFLTTVFWIHPDVNVISGIEYVLEDLLGLSPGPEVYQFLQRLLNPLVAYVDAIQRIGMDADVPQLEELGSVPFYLESWFALVILGVWLVVPLAIGYYKFESAEIA